MGDHPLKMASTAVKVTYWRGRGRAEPLRNIIAAGGETFENSFIGGRKEMLELVETKKLAYDQVPLVEIDGLDLVQGFPTAVYLGQRFGLYPSDPKKAWITGHIFAASQDARGAIIGFPFSGDAETKLKAFNVARYGAKWEGMLSEAGPFFLGAEASIGDAVMRSLGRKPCPSVTE